MANAWTASLLFGLLAICLMATPVAHAQDSDPDELIGTTFNAFAGNFLPYGIYGVRNLYPFWGVRYGHTVGTLNTELSGIFVDALGTGLTDLAASLVVPFAYGGIKYKAFFGGDFVYYHGETTTAPTPYAAVVGVHFGFSPVIELTHFLAIRTDFKMNIGPGQSLDVDCGLEFNFAKTP